MLKVRRRFLWIGLLLLALSGYALLYFLGTFTQGKTLNEVVEVGGWTILVRTVSDSWPVHPNTTYEIKVVDGFPLVSINGKPAFKFTNFTERVVIESLDDEAYNFQLSHRPGDDYSNLTRAEELKVPRLGIGAIFLKKFKGEWPIVKFYFYRPGEWKDEYKN